MTNVDRMTTADWEQVRSIYLEGLKSGNSTSVNGYEIDTSFDEQEKIALVVDSPVSGLYP